jgi:hypothetical protein
MAKYVHVILSTKGRLKSYPVRWLDYLPIHFETKQLGIFFLYVWQLKKKEREKDRRRKKERKKEREKQNNSRKNLHTFFALCLAIEIERMRKKEIRRKKDKERMRKKEILRKK